MKIEIGQVYVLSNYPKVVGVVTGVKDSKKDSWYIQTTLADRLVWNNKSETWRGETDFEKLSEDTLLVSNECCGGCCEEAKVCCADDMDTQPLDINIGEKWISAAGESILIISIDENSDGDIMYTGVVKTELGVDIGIFDRYGNDILGEYELTYLDDVLFESWEL